MNLKVLDQVISQECGLVKDQAILAGVSGGPDSLCMLHLLHELGYQVTVAHVNHQLRPEADREAETVQEYCTSIHVPFLYQKKLSIEESARILRYTWLMESAQKISAQALAVAHQADDQVETMLMHTLRGAGPSGLKGMTYRSYNPVFSQTIPVVRPLLGVWREEIVSYCSENHLSPCYDQTNADPTYFRNRIRSELIPYLKSYNTNAAQHLWQLTQIVGSEDRYLQDLTQQAFSSVVQ